MPPPQAPACHRGVVIRIDNMTCWLLKGRMQTTWCNGECSSPLHSFLTAIFCARSSCRQHDEPERREPEGGCGAARPMATALPSGRHSSGGSGIQPERNLAQSGSVDEGREARVGSWSLCLEVHVNQGGAQTCIRCL